MCFLFRCKFSVFRARKSRRAAGAMPARCKVRRLRRLWCCPYTGGLAVLSVPLLPPLSNARFFCRRCQFLKERDPKKFGPGYSRGPGTLFFAFSCPVLFPLSPRVSGVSIPQPLTMHKYTKNIDTLRNKSKIFYVDLLRI